jgi:hypothetical protein
MLNIYSTLFSMCYTFYVEGLNEKRQNFNNEFLTSDATKRKLEKEMCDTDCQLKNFTTVVLSEMCGFVSLTCCKYQCAVNRYDDLE